MMRKCGLLLVATFSITQVMAQAVAPTSTLPDGAGKNLVIKYCSQCHELKRIEDDQGTEAEWITRIRRMTRRGATIPSDQIEPLGRYLASVLPPRVRSRAGESSPIATAVAEAAVRPIQTWVRAGGRLQTDVVSVVASIAAADAAHVKVGDRARAFAISARSSMYQARVTSVKPIGQTAQVSLRLSRPGPTENETYLVEIVTEQSPTLSIPNEAIIEEGHRQVVYVQRDSGDYVSREVKTGLQGELHTQVLSGLRAGEHVVTFGSFFIDAEYKLKSRSDATESNDQLNVTYRGLPDPPREGAHSAEVTVKHATGLPVTDATVNVVYSMAAMPSMNMPEMRSTFPLTHEGGGRYSGDTRFSMPGTWQINVTVTTNEGTVEQSVPSVNVK